MKAFVRALVKVGKTLVGGVGNYIIRLHELYFTLVYLRCPCDVYLRLRAGRHENFETSDLHYTPRALTYLDQDPVVYNAYSATIYQELRNKKEITLLVLFSKRPETR